MDRHGGGAEHHRDVDRDIVECRQGAPALILSLWFRSYILWPCHGYPVVNTRDDLTIGLLPQAGAPPVEWRVSEERVDYDAALAAMDARTAAIARGEARELAWLIEHPPLYTAGTSSQPQQLIEARFPVHVAGRGGQFTYHGPGQRVGYVMLDLKRRAPDVRRFVVTIEEWIIRTLAAFNVRGERRDDRIGVWVRRPDKGDGCEDKIAAIGIRIQRWVTLHGFALNIEPELAHFSGIVPCGVADQRYGVTSLADLGVTVSMPEVDMVLRSTFAPLFGATIDDQTVGSTENNSPRRRSFSSSAVPSR
jgi:lipoyl(octanoyl) transferase